MDNKEFFNLRNAELPEGWAWKAWDINQNGMAIQQSADYSEWTLCHRDDPIVWLQCRHNQWRGNVKIALQHQGATQRIAGFERDEIVSQLEGLAIGESE